MGKSENEAKHSFKKDKFFSQGRCDHTQRTPSVTPLVRMVTKKTLIMNFDFNKEETSSTRFYKKLGFWASSKFIKNWP